MATKTFEELKQLAIQIRDEKTNKQNTATRIGTQMLEHLDKLEQDYYDKTATDEELKERDEKLTELESKINGVLIDVNIDTELNKSNQYSIDVKKNTPFKISINTSDENYYHIYLGGYDGIFIGYKHGNNTFEYTNGVDFDITYINVFTYQIGEDLSISIKFELKDNILAHTVQNTENIQSNKVAIDVLNSDVYKIKTIDFTESGFVGINGKSGESEIYVRTLYEECKQGDIIYLNCLSGSGTNTLSFYDEKREYVVNGNIVGDKTRYTDFKVICPITGFFRACCDIVTYADTPTINKETSRIEELEKASQIIDSIDNLHDISDNPLRILKRDCGYASITHDWGFVGDSLSSGEMECYDENGDLVPVPECDFYDYSWGQRLCKLCGVEGYNFSYGGQTARGWITGYRGEEVETYPERCWKNGSGGAVTNIKQAYIIALGVNDQISHVTLGSKSDIDISNYENNADTFYGNYAGIIQRLRSVQPRCIIFTVTMPNDRGEGSEYNQAIRTITEMFDKSYLIDLETYAVDYKSEQFRKRYYMNGHMNAAGYQYTAYLMNTYIDWIIRNNWDDFIDVSLIGTNYTKDKPNM